MSSGRKPTPSSAQPGVSRQHQLISLYLKPLQACADEVNNLRGSGKSTFGKDDVVVKRILNQLERIFTADFKQDPGAFFDFLLCAVAFIAENDTEAGSVARLKGRFATSATEQLSQIRFRMTSAADALRGKMNMDDAAATRDRSASTIANGGVLSAGTELDLLLRPIESVQALDISNRLDSLHYWLLRCLRLPGSFQATIRRCVATMPDILIGFVGSNSPLFLPDEEANSNTSQSPSSSSQQRQQPQINEQFIEDFITVIGRLESHPTMGPTVYDININTMELFQTATSHGDDYRGPGVVDMFSKGKKNDHQIRFKIGIKTKGLNKRKQLSRKFHGVGVTTVGGAVMLDVVDQKLQTDDAITGYVDPSLHQHTSGVSGSPSSPNLWTPYASGRHWSPGDPLTNAAAAQNIMSMSSMRIAGSSSVTPSASPMMADNTKEEVFEKRRQQQRGGGGKDGGGGGMLCRNQGVQPEEMFQVLSFPELCAMYRAVESDQAKVKSDWETLRKRDEELKEKERRYERSMQNVAKVIINLNDLYKTHALKVREKQLLGQRVLIQDFDKKVEDVLNVFDVGDFDLVEDEDELNAAGVVSQQNFLSSNRFSARDMAMTGGGDSFAFAGATKTFSGTEGGGQLVPPTRGGRPLVVVDEEETKAPHTQVGSLELKLREPQEVERSVQLRKQNSRCSDCGVFFGEESENRLVDVVKKASQRIMHQKPRRCHYCTQHLCHTCHVNDTSILPFRALLKWDFTYEHVCKKCHRFLEANFDRALFDIRRIAPEIRQRKLVMCCMDIRRHLIRAAFVVRECTHRTSAELLDDLNTHYFMREFFYSLKDLYKLAKEETKDSTPIAYVPGVSSVIDLVNSVAGADTRGLNSFLASKLLKCREHISITCSSCRNKASMPCTICHRVEPVFVYDENADQCHDCRCIYHEACLQNHECPVCSSAATESISAAPSAQRLRL